MKCHDVRKRIPAYALGELDSEPAAELRTHVSECAACRAEAVAMDGAVRELRKCAAPETSADRRDAAVAAMSAAALGAAEVRAPRRRLAWAVAAAVVLGAAGLIAMLMDRGVPAPEVSFRADEVRGRAEIFRAEAGGWAALRTGDQVVPGDRVVTHGASVVRFDFAGGRVFADQDSSFAVTAHGAVVLERGRLVAELPEGVACEVRDTANNVAVLRGGPVEAGLLEAYSLEPVDKGVLPAEDPEAVVKWTDLPFRQVAEEVARLTGRPVEMANEEVARRNVTFASRHAEGAELFGDFVRAMEAQSVAIQDGRANLYRRALRLDGSRRLFARVVHGEAELRGTHEQRLIATAGREGHFDLDGRPEVRARETGPVASWRDPGYYDPSVRGRVILGTPVAFRSAGRDAEGNPVVQCRIENSETMARIEDMAATVRVPAGEIERSAGDGADVVIPLNVRVDLK